ncbi:MAG: hypothetical protein KDA93_17355 [Planctomycetaceae bacterium]|nr:hypothetical protein [Planctomycetaceae bacterium]
MNVLVPMTDRSQRVITLADESARNAGMPAGPEHVLRGLVEEHDGLAGHVLDAYRVDLIHIDQCLNETTSDDRVSDSTCTTGLDQLLS